VPAEIRDLAAVYLGRPGAPVGPHLAALLRRARDRADTRIASLQDLRDRIDQALARGDLAGDARGTPTPGTAACLTFPPGASRSVWHGGDPRARTQASQSPGGEPAGRRATGPAGHAVNAAVFAALYATPWYAPPLGFTSDAALIFYGASMLLAAARGYARR